MSEQGRKQEDSSAHKSSRTNTVIPPQLGASPSLLPYALPPPSLQPHEFAAHPLYSMMRPGSIGIAPQMAPHIPSAKPCMTNEMGPPIFMPSLNLGTPRSSSSASVPSPLPPSSSSSTSSPSPGTNVGSNPSGAAGSSSGGGPIHSRTMSDMILSNAPSVPSFHPLHPFYSSGPGIRPGQPGQPQYISIATAPPPQVPAVAGGNKRPAAVSVTTIAKPTPLQASHSPKVGSFGKSLSGGHPSSKGMSGGPAPPGGNSTMLVTSSASGHGLHPAAISISSAPQTANFLTGSSVIKHSSSRQSQTAHHQQQQQHFSQGKQKVYLGAQTDTGPDSMASVFFAHPTMQGHMISLPYSAMMQSHGMAGAVPPGHPPPPHSHPTSSTLTELLAPGVAVGSPPQRDGGGGKQGKVHDMGMRPYSPGQQQHHQVMANRHGPTAPGSHMRERSGSGDASSGKTATLAGPPGQPLSHSTTAQPTPTATHSDTKLDRPAQPSSASLSQSSQLPSPQNMPSSYQGPHRERSNSSEVSNIIITMPGLTGRHIAAISGNQPPGFPNGSQPQTGPPQPADPYRGSRIKSEYVGGGGSGGQVMDSSPVALPHLTPMHMMPQSATQITGTNPGLVGGGKTAKPSSAPTFGQLAAHPSPSLPASLTATVIPSSASSSSSSSSSSANSPAPPLPNSLPLSASGGSPSTAAVSPSRRPGIIRKRPHEGSSVQSVSLASPGHAPSGDHSNHSGTLQPSSHPDPLSPPISTSSSSFMYSHPTDTLTNHVAAGRADPSIGEILPSPRKKRRKQDVIATDDQYASNVPNNIRTDVAMTTDEDHLHSSPHHQGAAVTMVTRARGRADEPVQRDERVVPPPPETERSEVRYLSQLRQSQWPINGMYRMHHRAASNHFKRHADIKHIEVEKVSASNVANDSTAMGRASGWKIYRLEPQMEEMLQVEQEMLTMMEKVEESISNLEHCVTCCLPSDVLSGFNEILKGNVARSTRIISHMETARTKMFKILDHKPTVLDVLRKYSTTKRPSPTNSLSHKLRT